MKIDKFSGPPEQKESKQIAIPPKEFIRQLKAILPEVMKSATKEDILELREIITRPLIHKNCARCLKPKPEIDGRLEFLDGDMTKPKRWVCGDCR